MDKGAFHDAGPAAIGALTDRARQLGQRQIALVGRTREPLRRNPADPLAGVGNAVVFTLFDPAAFGGTAHFLAQTTALSEYVRGCPTAEGKSITLPGDPERRSKAERSKAGIPIPDGTWKLLTDCAAEHGVAVP